MNSMAAPVVPMLRLPLMFALQLLLLLLLVVLPPLMVSLLLLLVLPLLGITRQREQPKPLLKTAHSR